jgi:hypothetical protein
MAILEGGTVNLRARSEAMLLTWSYSLAKTSRDVRCVRLVRGVLENSHLYGIFCIGPYSRIRSFLLRRDMSQTIYLDAKFIARLQIVDPGCQLR